ncbi:MAG: hypothetical protein IJH50_05410 [Kiritimatiellae bacterium]|nr:hypothetical protein [Kiritimatiellia bacterium]
MIEDMLPYAVVLVSTLLLTLLLTPLVRETNRRFGLVDRPDARRINKVPIPRGGGIALVAGVLVPYAIFHLVTGRPWVQGLSDAVAYKVTALAVVTALVGFADDIVSLRSRVKLAFQIVIAALVWAWAGLGFRVLWPALPAWFDFLLTVFWVTGAINAFNLIDGLDGLATGLALIAVFGMAGSLFLASNPQTTLFYFAMMGGLVGFLFYNYNPASVFLGDSGSMFLGFVIAVLPLASQTPDSFLVSVGVPMLAMGVPVFDTALAILRRTIRRMLAGGGSSGAVDRVMTADTDHLHHRILRSVGLDQRKATWILYGLSAAAVVVGLVALSLRSHAAGLWMAAMAVAAFVICRDTSIEFFDAGRLLGDIAHSSDRSVRRRLAGLTVPFYVALDLIVLVSVFFVCSWAMRMEVDLRALRTVLLLRVLPTFVALAYFRAYSTIWSRAVTSNFVRLLLACAVGSIAGSVVIYYWPSLSSERLKAMTLAYAAVSFVMLASVRVFRGVVRDLFYAVDCSRLRNRRDVSRVLVYGAGLRYRMFRRELVRSASANDRIIVGILDDDVCLRGKYIGGIRILGTINQAPDVINSVNADTVVIACDITDDWLKVVLRILEPTGVKVTVFSFAERALQGL